MSLITRVDVTAVKLHRNSIIAGTGSYISIFDKSTTSFLQRIEALKGQKVYGIVPSDGFKFLIFGGKQFTVLQCEKSEGSLICRSFEAIFCDDWLNSGIWVDEDKVALLTAHNVVQIWNTATKTIISRHASKDNSILYSGLLLRLKDDVLVFAGTVFSQVIIHRSKSDRPLHQLKGHRGVIFSVSCDLQRGIIVTTSDDRSVRIWSVTSTGDYPQNSIKHWENASIVCKHEVYGHLARVMRSCISDNFVISIGEDSAICFWDFDGKLLRKNLSHNNSSIWSLDANDTHLVTGGGDCSIVIHPLTVATDYGVSDIINIGTASPKKIIFTARRNIIVLDDNDTLIYFDNELREKTVFKLNHESTYKLISLSSCKQMLAVTDMCGNFQIFIENCKDVAKLQNFVGTKLQVGKILSMQWTGNRHIVFCCDNGNITVLAANGNNIDVFANFVLPTCKERWLTASAIDSTNKIIVVGDRCGNVHIYVQHQKNPIKTFNKVHGRYGPTSITIKNNELFTTGRDGTIKLFSIEHKNGIEEVKLLNSRDLEFQWVEKFVDKDKKVVCGFQERVFVVFDVKTNIKLFEMPCGGGHRSWDLTRYIIQVNGNYEEFFNLIFVKNSDINSVTFQTSKIISRNVINGSHSKEINCLKSYQPCDETITFYVSGGEDTTLRISSINEDLCFKDDVVFKHLSNIRTVKLCTIDNNEIIVISAGGRAQICIKSIKFTKTDNEWKIISNELVDYMIKGTDKERKGNQTWRNCSVDFDPETRIMDLDVIKTNDNAFIVMAGCSDACLRIYNMKYTVNEIEFEPVKEVKYHKTCILKTHVTKFNYKDILVTCTTRGEIAVWDISNIVKDDANPDFNTIMNKSGINSIDTKVIDNKLLIATGGDDNSIHLKLIKADENDVYNIIDCWASDKVHSSQITGVSLIDNLLLSTSIDQRVSLLKIMIDNDKIKGEFASQIFSDVADVQGMDIINISSDTVTVCVFGKGMEVIALPKPK